MGEDEGRHGSTAGGDRPPGGAVEEQDSRWRRWSVLLPALAFLAGLLLGGAVLGAAGRSDDQTGATGERVRPSATPTPSPSGGDLLVRVPGPCLQAADRAEQAYALLERGVTAARDLDARALADLVDQVQQQRPEVQALVERCRAAAATAVVQPSPTMS